MEILRVEGVTKQFTKHTALNDVSFSIPRGSIYGLLGPNGAGKTTLIRIINRITAPDTGRILFDGKELTPEDVARIGYLPEERGLYKKMRVGEQAIYFAMLRGLSRQEATKRIKKWFIRFDIKDWWDKRVEELSKGMAQKVQFIVTVLHEPELLILDEPFSGFDPINTQLVTDEILRLRSEGATVIFSTHNMESVERLCDHITLINKAQNILSGEVREIRNQHGNNIFEVQYIGSSAQLKQSLEGKCTILTEATEDVRTSLMLHIPAEQQVSNIISLLNTNVDIRSFQEIIPSMNDIFIKAVAGEI